MREQTYDVEKLKIYVEQQKQRLNFDQKHVFETVINKNNTNTGGFYFLDAPGGTGEMENISVGLNIMNNNIEIFFRENVLIKFDIS